MCQFIPNIFYNSEFWKISIPMFVALVTLVGSHQFAIKRQIDEQRRKQRIEYLSASFKALMIFSNNKNIEEAARHLREASILIQFLGTKWQVEQMQLGIEALKPGGSFSLEPLLCSLRDELRATLGIEKIDGVVYWVHPDSLPMIQQNEARYHK